MMKFNYGLNKSYIKSKNRRKDEMSILCRVNDRKEMNLIY